MSEGQEPGDSASRRLGEQRAPERTMPRRPQMSDLTPAPIHARIPPPGTIKAARAAWILSFLAAALMGTIAYFARDKELERLRQLINGMQQADADTLHAVASAVLWGSLAVVGLVVLVEMVLLAALMRRRSGVRWVQLGVLLLHGGATVLADAVLVDVAEQGPYLRVLLLAQLALAAAGLLTSLLPGAERWFRATHEPTRRRLQ
ncbi:hypothetical protein [Arthrobacter mangrovi]|nr:hypothetical protein [Arthrobacter mangrovi]